jgi:hypothetical protein
MAKGTECGFMDKGLDLLDCPSDPADGNGRTEKDELSEGCSAVVS